MAAKAILPLLTNFAHEVRESLCGQLAYEKSRADILVKIAQDRDAKLQPSSCGKHIMFYWDQYDCVCNICKDEQAEYERGLSDGQQNPIDGEGYSKEG